LQKKKVEKVYGGGGAFHKKGTAEKNTRENH